MKAIFVTLLLTCFASIISAQEIHQVKVDKTDIGLRGAPVVLGQISITTSLPGKILVRFDGECISSEGDKINLAASDSPNWGPGDQSINFTAISSDLNSNVFTHTRVYTVGTGTYTFYAVGENKGLVFGTGKASVYGNLTAEYFPNGAGKAFVQFSNINQSNLDIEGPPVTLATQTFTIPAAGKLVARFDGMCESSDGDLVLLAVNDNQLWLTYESSATLEAYNANFNHNCFANIRQYDITPGTYTLYALVQNNYEVYGNGIASVSGTFSISYYPNTSSLLQSYAQIAQIGVKLDNGPVNIGQVSLHTPISGQIAVSYTGTLIGSYGDYIRMGITDAQAPDWDDHCASFGMEPVSADRNRISFSHTRVFDAGPGDHIFNLFAQNILETDGSGLAVIYGDAIATFYPSGSVGTTEETLEKSRILIAPNPGQGVFRLEFPSFSGERISLQILGMDAREYYRQEIENASGHAELDLFFLPKGIYQVRIQGDGGIQSAPFVRL